MAGTTREEDTRTSEPSGVKLLLFYEPAPPPVLETPPPHGD